MSEKISMREFFRRREEECGRSRSGHVWLRRSDPVTDHAWRVCEKCDATETIADSLDKV